jgi:hypothetical protein
MQKRNYKAKRKEGASEEINKGIIVIKIRESNI